MHQRVFATPFLAGLVFTAFYYCNAYLCYDAVIIYRTIDNLIHGFGLRWNVVERVQVFTSPLHTLYLIPFYWLVTDSEAPPSPGRVYFVATFSSYLLSLGSVLLFCRSSRNTIGFWGVFAVLLCSQAFVTFASSGLETSLTYLLIAAFFTRFFAVEKLRRTEVFSLLLIASLAVVNRLDTSLLFLPAAIHVLLWSWKEYGKVTILYALAASLPMILWFSFAMIYFGFLFPNSYYAKTGYRVDPAILRHMGMLYLEKSLRYDPATLVTISVGFVLSLRNWRLLTAGIGIAAYVCYIASIGGDFIGHRFLAAPVLLAALVVYATVDRIEFDTKLLVRGVTGLVALCLVYSLSNQYSPLLRYWNPPPRGDVRYYWNSSSLANWTPGREFPFEGAFHALDSADECARLRAKTWTVAVTDGGMRGFCRGPKYHLVNSHSVTDPLIARLPKRLHGVFWPGHVSKGIPAGYVESIRSGENRIADPELARYYAQLKRIVSGPIWSVERGMDILEMNLTDRARYHSNYIAADPPPEIDRR